ncbi:hypothetical protein SMACR_09652 [Sordaria macrospora]|uniref:WGS project CABT00000000 data, contig 2.112 n=2 Tax=Sordaria macrospora TaxID=5147 RepID=F7WCC1_SORMK|nr:uncharacterized protein SMAC_09652 [Sordaria macrospora k-hell]KAA8622109.1 hypothetical protein SMACR_09652 [Sordaria macrospora]WPJ60735.1 hypothetical protein SMAC4_09652 [Sordaria macrospora]CCC14572.1 unnamed protein product [Sordaria macrospora k-hell]
MDLDEFEEFHDSQDGGEQPEGDSSTPSDGLVKGLLKALSGSASLRDRVKSLLFNSNPPPILAPRLDFSPAAQAPVTGAPSRNAASAARGVRTDREAAWIEILDTLPLDKQQRLEGFWTAKTASGDDDPVALLDQIRIIFGAYQMRDSALDKLFTVSLSDDYRTCVAQLQYHAAKYEQTSEFKEDHHKYLRGQRNRSRSSNNYYLPALSVGNTQGPQSQPQSTSSSLSAPVNADGDTIMGSTRVGRGRGSRGRGGLNPATYSSKRAKWVSEKERQKRRDNNLCLRCGASGHYVGSCPYQPAVPPSNNVRTQGTAIEVPPLLEEEDESSTSEQGKE